ncbi:MAG: hypothetical protein ACD_9C00307G0005 [uncultured bacterium]|nr:MAG: hypothetical protein ACD_9C00307G0005 [uncultured bacterium]
MPSFEQKFQHHFLEQEDSVAKTEVNTDSVLKAESARFYPHDKKIPFGSLPFIEYKAIANNEEVKEKENQAPSALKMPLRPFDAKYSARKFTANPILEENRKLHIATEIKQQSEANKKLFKSGKIKEISEFLLNEKVHDLEFEKEINKTKEEYGEQLSSATFLNNKDWKILTGIKLFNKETLEHSIGTYLVAKEKIEKRLKELGIEIQQEGATLEQFYRACLFHDVGKMAIPEFILRNETTDHEWAIGLAMLNENEKDEIFIRIFDERGLTITDDIRHDPDALADFFEENRIRAVDFVPIKSILNKQQLEQFEEMGLDPNKPLKKIMELHEKGSEEILKNLGFVIESMLAGNHHNYNHKDKKLGEKPVSLSILHISIEISSTILHLADVQHALNGGRSYHHKQPMLRILAFLIDDAKRGKILPDITALWIKDELSKMNSAYLHEVRTMSASHQDAKYKKQRRMELELIEDFLEENLHEKIISGLPSQKINPTEKTGYADNYEEVENYKQAI